MTLVAKNFYLNTPMVRYKYVQIKMDDIPNKIIVEYNLCNKVSSNGHIYVKNQKGMYGLPQAGILAQELLEKQLNEHGYSQSKAVLGLWTHKTQSISFTLVVDDFGVKYVGKEHAMQLLVFSKSITKFLRIGQAVNTLELPWTGTTATGGFTYPCQGISPRNCNVLGMSIHNNCKTLHICMWPQHMVQRRSMWRSRIQVCH